MNTYETGIQVVFDERNQELQVDVDHSNLKLQHALFISISSLYQPTSLLH